MLLHWAVVLLRWAGTLQFGPLLLSESLGLLLPWFLCCCLLLDTCFLYSSLSWLYSVGLMGNLNSPPVNWVV